MLEVKLKSRNSSRDTYELKFNSELGNRVQVTGEYQIRFLESMFWEHNMCSQNSQRHLWEGLLNKRLVPPSSIGLSNRTTIANTKSHTMSTCTKINQFFKQRKRYFTLKSQTSEAWRIWVKIYFQFFLNFFLFNFCCSLSSSWKNECFKISVYRWKYIPGGGNSNPLQYSCLEKFHGQRRLAGYSPCSHKELDMTEYTYRGWGGQMASPTQWAWVWVNSGSWFTPRQGGLACCSPWDRKESDMTERLNWAEHTYMHTHIILVKSLITLEKKAKDRGLFLTLMFRTFE